MSEWKIKEIRKIGSVITGKTPPKDQDKYFSGDHLFVSPKDLDWDTLYIFDTETKISKEALDKFKNQVIPRNAIMYTSLSFAFGKIGIASEPLLTNQQIHSIVVNSQNNFRFVYYLLRANRPLIFSYNSGIDTPIVPKSVFEKIELKIPSLPPQKKIAAILSAYDDLIEKNNRRIAILEKMAEEIYREWFVRLRFPGHEQVKFNKGIPEGWERKRFDEFCLLQRGYDLPDSKVIPGQYPVIASTSIKTYHNQFKVNPPVITTGRSGSLGTVLFINSQAWPLNTTLFVKNFYSNAPYLIYYTLKFLKLENFNAGAGVPTLNRNHLGGLYMSIPPKNLQNNFNDKIAIIFKQKELVVKLNNNLAETRDRLLTRLISGKLSVEDLDIQFPPSMREELE